MLPQAMPMLWVMVFFIILMFLLVSFLYVNKFQLVVNTLNLKKNWEFSKVGFKW